LLAWDHLRAAYGLPLADAAQGDGLRQRQHLLAALSRVDATGSLAGAAPAAVAVLGPAGPDQLGACRDRQRLGTSDKRGAHTGPNPTDRGKRGCKRHTVSEATGIPLLVCTGPANQPDAELALPMLDALPACAGARGRPRRKPDSFQGDGAYGIRHIIRQVVARRVRSLLAPYGRARTEHGSGLGKTRYVIERTLSWVSNFRRLKLCYERTGEHFQAFHELAACLICADKIEAMAA
jgi:hypothetical protein